MDTTRPDGARAARLRRVAPAIALAASAIVIAACGGSSGPTDDRAAPSTAPASAPGTPVPSAPGSSTAAPGATSAAMVPAACEGGLEVASVGTVDAAAGAELSGIVASREHRGAYWVHNDSGAGPQVHAISGDGTLLATYDLGTDAVDWEDIAIAPGADGSGWSLLVGDIGDNAEARPDIQIFRIAEPDVDPARPATGPQPVPAVDTITLAYPDRPHNAEALLVDPDTGQLVIITKEITGPAQVLVAEADDLADGATVELTAAGTLDLGGVALTSWVTAADISPDGTLVAVRTYGGVHLFAREPGQSVADALAGPACAAPPPLEAQGEAIAIEADGQTYLTVAEGETPILHRTAPVGG